jgi:hypothetical protein
MDEAQTCTCGMVVCPSCKGYDTQRKTGNRFREALRLLGRANQVLKLELSTSDREFVVDLVHRLSDGVAPRWIDFFKLQEIYDQGTGTKTTVYVPPEYLEGEFELKGLIQPIPKKTPIGTVKPNLKLVPSPNDHVVATPPKKSRDPRRDPD